MLCQPGSLPWRAAGRGDGQHPAHPWPYHWSLPIWVSAADSGLSSAAQGLRQKGGSLGSTGGKPEMSSTDTAVQLALGLFLLSFVSFQTGFSLLPGRAAQLSLRQKYIAGGVHQHCLAKIQLQPSSSGN